MPEIIILINALVYIGTSCFFLKKEGLTVRTFLWVYLSIFTIGSVYLLWTRLYFDVMDYPHFKDNEDISFITYVFNYLFCFMFLNVTQRFRTDNLRVNFKYNRTTEKVTKWILLIEIIYFFLKIVQALVVFNFGFGNFHELGKENQNAILYGSIPLLLYVNYLGKFVNMVIMPYIILHQFYGYRRGAITSSTFLWVAVLFSVNTLLVGIVAGSRATLLFGILNILFFVVLLYRYLNKRLVKRGLLLGIIATVTLYLVTGSITHERFEKAGTMSVSDNIARYLGEAQLNLTYEYQNHLLHHTDGVYTFGDFFSKKVDFTSTIAVHSEWFKTAYGCFFVDFGLYIPLIIVFCIMLFFRRLIPKKNQSSRHFLICYYYYTFCAWLPFNFEYSPFDIFIFCMMLLVPNYLRSSFEICK